MGGQLHLCCGDKVLPPPWVNADARPGPGVDLLVNLHDPWQLPTSAYSWVYCSHAIEHLHPDRLHLALLKLRNSLEPGGRLTLATISLEGIYRNAFERGYPRKAVNAYLYGDAGSADNPLQAHRQVFTEAWLTESLREAGFSAVRPWALSQYPEIAKLNDCAGSSYHVTLYLEGVR